ncbi:hypothetical protein [Spiroplasma endosymbiont of 'Nebria riversi']|uniref:hypothetical protein n=1 Tax=Spiroplasma endosymbiont of 'Nebria riversi' TaxID=2792084 RepID=UPI001C055E6E|nr:hypothetical protein [Spiroplasma endosymbiont of 'Nebria riversi']
MDLLGAWGIIGFIAMILLEIKLVFVVIWSLDRLLVKRKKAVKATSIEEQDNTIEEVVQENIKEVKVKKVKLDGSAVPDATTIVEIHQNNKEVPEEKQETVQETKL